MVSIYRMSGPSKMCVSGTHPPVLTSPPTLVSAAPASGQQRRHGPEGAHSPSSSTSPQACRFKTSPWRSSGVLRSATNGANVTMYRSKVPLRYLERGEGEEENSDGHSGTLAHRCGEASSLKRATAPGLSETPGLGLSQLPALVRLRREGELGGRGVGDGLSRRSGGAPMPSQSATLACTCSSASCKVHMPRRPRVQAVGLRSWGGNAAMALWRSSGSTVLPAKSSTSALTPGSCANSAQLMSEGKGEALARGSAMCRSNDAAMPASPAEQASKRGVSPRRSRREGSAPFRSKSLTSVRSRLRTADAKAS
mmetsp:Transcript_67674/g.144826  ORF Transcript_67674/g.144826 Transcript_67674/m.144826 type:complete len:310 (+) Transcript_67674:750-1679(+)